MVRLAASGVASYSLWHAFEGSEMLSSMKVIKWWY